MPRNSSGSYTTPAGQPVVSGTTISASVHNALVSDLAAEVTDSLSRSGKGGMTAPLRTADGTAASPSHSFTNDTDTGLYGKGANNPAMSVAGTARQEWTTAGSVVSGTFEATGNTAVGGTLGVTGAATLSSGATVSGGNLDLSNASAQSIWKANAALNVGTQTNHDLAIYRNNSAALTFGSSGPAFAGKPTAAATESADGATTLATKGYVDAATGMTDGESSISMGTDWTTGATRTWLYKMANGLVVLQLGAFIRSSGSSATVCTLPAGYRPAADYSALGVDASAVAIKMFSVNAAGTITATSSITNTNQHYLQVVFPAA